jgi:hypothetical protein
MKTQVNGIEITPAIAGVLDKWYDNATSYENTLFFSYIMDLGEIQDFLCRMICDVDVDDPELKHAISVIINIKDDMKKLIPDRNSDTDKNS